MRETAPEIVNRIYKEALACIKWYHRSDSTIKLTAAQVVLVCDYVKQLEKTDG